MAVRVLNTICVAQHNLEAMTRIRALLQSILISTGKTILSLGKVSTGCE